MFGCDVVGRGGAGRGQVIACGKSGWVFVGREGARTFAGTGGGRICRIWHRGALIGEVIGTMEDTEFDGAVGMN